MLFDHIGGVSLFLQLVLFDYIGSVSLFLQLVFFDHTRGGHYPAANLFDHRGVVCHYSCS